MPRIKDQIYPAQLTSMIIQPEILNLRSVTADMVPHGQNIAQFRQKVQDSAKIHLSIALAAGVLGVKKETIQAKVIKPFNEHYKKELLHLPKKWENLMQIYTILPNFS